MSEKTLATVIWSKADTYDVFKIIWSVGGLTLSDPGKATADNERTQRVALPTKEATDLERKLQLLDPTSRLAN